MRAVVLGFVLAYGWSLVPPAASAQAPPGNTLPPAKARAVDAAVQVEMAKQQVVGLAVGIIEGGRIIYLKGYGQADREKGTPVTIDTVFNWASNSKPLAAVAAMQLIDKKLLDLNADIRLYVPEFSATGGVITTRHLLCHQSGIPHYSNGKVVPTTREYSTAQPFMDPVLALDRFNRSPLLFAPGEKASYSSYAYILLSAVVQRAGKAPFPDQVRDRIAKPLGIASLQLDLPSKDQKDWAAGYTKDSEGRVTLAAEDANYWKHGAGGFKSNVRDFARWAEALLNHRVVSEASERRMWTPQATSTGETTTWGLGFTVDPQAGLRVSHNGDQPEVSTRLVIYPRARRGVVVMCNGGFANQGAFTTAVLAALNRN